MALRLVSVKSHPKKKALPRISRISRNSFVKCVKSVARLLGVDASRLILRWKRLVNSPQQHYEIASLQKQTGRFQGSTTLADPCAVRVFIVSRQKLARRSCKTHRRDAGREKKFGMSQKGTHYSHDINMCDAGHRPARSTESTRLSTTGSH
jgi:hypothetical protein